MVMESMNHKIDHPGMFLHTIPQAYALARAVDSPSIKILFDFYHVQIEEGNLLPRGDRSNFGNGGGLEQRSPTRRAGRHRGRSPQLKG